jgi:hypothetical protein
MRRLSLQLAVLFGSLTLLAIACTPGPAPDDDDDDDDDGGISCATADEEWTTCAAVTGSPTPPPFCASLAAGTIGGDSDWGCIASLLTNWDCASGLPASLAEFGTCINLDPGDDDDTSGDDDTGDDDTIGDDDDSVPSGPCTDDSSEPNNDFATAIPAGTGGSYTVCPDDDDFFSITVNAGSYLQVNLTFLDEEGDIDLKIKDAADTNLASSGSTSDDEAAAFLADTTATYYIWVTLYSDSGAIVGNTYNMTVATGTPGAEDCGDSLDNDFDGDTDCADSDCDGNANCLEDCGDGIDNDGDFATDCADSSCDGDPACVCPTDAFEDNDAWDTPKPVSAGTHAGLSVCPQDEDWYTFSSNSLATIDFTFSDVEGDLDCKLYDADTFDPNNLFLSLASGVGVADTESCTGTTAATQGNYLLRVYLASDNDTYPSDGTGIPGDTICLTCAFGNSYQMSISF